MGAKSKRKGNCAERELCKLLTELLSGSFVRVPNSGAAVGGKNLHRRQTLSKAQDRSFRGDIIPPDHLPHLVIESKSYQTFSFHAILHGPYALLDDWIKQTITVSDPEDQWFVAFKITRQGWYLAVPEVDCNEYVFGNYCAYTGRHTTVRITELVSFFRTNRAAVLLKAGHSNPPTTASPPSAASTPIAPAPIAKPRMRVTTETEANTIAISSAPTISSSQ